VPRAKRCETVDWNWSEFLHDEKVQAMEPVMLGLWVRVLGAAALAERPGWIPTERALVRASGATPEEWSMHGPAIMGMLERVGEAFVHRRTERDHREQTERVKAYRAFGKAGAKKRWDSPPNGHPISPPNGHPNGHPTVSGMAPPMPPTPTPLPLESSLASQDGPATPRGTRRNHAGPQAIKSLVPAFAAILEPGGKAVVAQGLALANRLATSGILHAGLLERFVRHYADNHARIANPHAYYNPKGPGFTAIRMALSIDAAADENEALKAAEAQWASRLGGAS